MFPFFVHALFVVSTIVSILSYFEYILLQRFNFVFLLFSKCKETLKINKPEHPVFQEISVYLKLFVKGKLNRKEKIKLH